MFMPPFSVDRGLAWHIYKGGIIKGSSDKTICRKYYKLYHHAQYGQPS